MNIITKNLPIFFNYKREFKKRIVIGETQTLNEDYLNLPDYNQNFFLGYHHFTITKSGLIYKHFPTDTFLPFLKKPRYDKENIYIALENISPIIKQKDLYFTIYNQIIVPNNSITFFNKKWKGYEWWIEYTDNQIKSLFELLFYLINKYEIKPKIKLSNNKSQLMPKYEGICFRSNYFDYFYDLNPAFPFKSFNKTFYERLYKRINNISEEA